MSLIKKAKDELIRVLMGSKTVPRGLFDLGEYFRLYGSINFRHQKENGNTIAISTNFRYGSIVTSGKTDKELDRNIRDAIMTSFEIPSSYREEAKIHKQGKMEGKYALA